MNVETIVLIFVCGVAGLSICILLLYFITKADDAPSAFHQNLAIGIFSVVVTAMVVLLGLATFAKDNVSTASGKIGVITFNIAGPPAVWIVVFLITSRAFGAKQRVLADRPAPALTKTLEYHYRMLGFDYYRNWFASLNEFRRVIEKSELHFIDDLLPKVFYHGPFGLIKPTKVTNTTLFFFSHLGAVKFQRIQGMVRAEGDKRSQVYLPHTSSTQSGHISCVHFVRGANGIYQTAIHSHGEWKIPPLNTIDILMVAIYEDDELDAGDYVYVDVSKYVDLERMDDATVELAIAADKTIDEFNVWEVSTSLESTERPVPLMFKNLDNQYRRTQSAIEKNIEQVRKMFNGWDSVIDQVMSGHLGRATGVPKDEVQSLLVTAKKILTGATAEDMTFEQVFRTFNVKDCVVSRLKRQRNVILSTFAWGG